MPNSWTLRSSRSHWLSFDNVMTHVDGVDIRENTMDLLIAGNSLELSGHITP